jgi:alpha-L-fucosidase
LQQLFILKNLFKKITMNQKASTIFILFFLLTHSLIFSAENVNNNKMDWWNEARFGMFIHWGVYAVYGNIYDGVDINGEQVHYSQGGSGSPAEWIMNLAKIPRAIYREAAKEFDAKDYDPKEWVRIAKDAGMKYIVITSKHHDGFCLFETQYTNWNSTDASAAKRDLLKDLVKEAKDAGLKIGFYYSQNLDWMAEGGMGPVPELNGGEYPIDKVEAYVNNQVIPQIKELTENYDIDLFWFDYPNVKNSNATISQRIFDTLLNSPVGNKIIYNNRLFAGFPGDFITPESDTPFIPYNGYDDNRAWEACASLNTTWGYEHPIQVIWEYSAWKSGIYTISRVLELSSKGGNFLLNVGPDKHGVIPEPAVNTLKEVGEWMKIYGETIYGTQKNSLLNPFEYGYVTEKKGEQDRLHWYLHVSSHYWPEKEIILPGLKTAPLSVTLFETKQQLPFHLKNDNLIIYLPDNCPNPYYSTIDLHFASAPSQVARANLKNNRIRLTPFQATATNGLKKDYVPYTFKYWSAENREIGYNIYLEAGEYTVEAEYAAWAYGGDIYFKLDNETFIGHYQNTGDPKIDDDLDNFIVDDLGGVKIIVPKSKIYSLTIKKGPEIPHFTSWVYLKYFLLKKEGSQAIIDIDELYPNPVKDGYFFVEKSDPNQTVRFYDFLGRCQKTGVIDANKMVNVSDLAPGIYIARGNRFAKRIIIR